MIRVNLQACGENFYSVFCVFRIYYQLFNKPELAGQNGYARGSIILSPRVFYVL